MRPRAEVTMLLALSLGRSEEKDISLHDGEARRRGQKLPPISRLVIHQRGSSILQQQQLPIILKSTRKDNHVLDDPRSLDHDRSLCKRGCRHREARPVAVAAPPFRRYLRQGERALNITGSTELTPFLSALASLSAMFRMAHLCPFQLAQRQTP